MYDKPRFLPAGDRALFMELGDSIEEECNAVIRGIVDFICEANIKGIEEAVPTYRSILVYYDPFVMNFYETVKTMEMIYKRINIKFIKKGSVVEIPVLYGGDAGPDLPFVAKHARLTEDEVIEIHCSRDYLIYMLGFIPGFTYLGGMDERIATPRLERPRERIPAGSVGIAEKQTAIYSIDSPGGWRIIGLTPVKLYDPDREQPILPRVGDSIRFRAITREGFDEIKRRVEEGTYQPEVIRGEEE
ncbi:MAG: 5-oxoprolinase subunit PxpB [Thermoanaerobacteraceae bacterium]|nr:5-oxoprolinase subunit PxpB [Thermoanaerobacteraceae bacterium]